MEETTGIPDTPYQGAQNVSAETNVSWQVIASSEGLILGQSPDQYAVYDQYRLYGSWPLTQEGYSYAVQTYEAHRQSLAHGIAYTVTGYEDPARLGLPTEGKVKAKSYASPMSYVGSTRRIIAWASKASKRNPRFSAITWVAAIIGLVFVWILLSGYYIIVFGLFGLFIFPYRLIRRSQRKSLNVQQTALATQQAMLQQMVAQQQGGYSPPAAYPSLEASPVPPPANQPIQPPQ